MSPVSSIGNDISSDLARRKMNDLPESPIGNNLEALAPGIEKLKQTSIEMVTLLNALQPGGKCIITGDFQKELAYLQNVILYNDSSLRMDFFGYNARIIQRSDNTCELTINEPLKNQEISTGNINVNCPLKDIYNEIRRLNVIFSCGTGGIVDLSSLDLRNVDLELYDFTDKHMANTILNPFKLDDTDFTNANMFQVNFVSSKQNATISWDYLLKITPVITSINDMYSEEKIKLVESCLNALGDITEEQLKIMRLAIIESIPRATLTDELENELTKEIYKSSSKINNYLNRIKLPEMKVFSLEKIDYYIDIIIKDYESVKENAYLIDPKNNYNTDLNIEDSSSEEFLSDNTLEKDENSPDNCFEVVKYNRYEAYNSEKQYFTREDYTYDYWICPYISRHLLSLNPLLARCRRYSRGER
ncbi:YhaC family protein [Escherichia coli]|nr:YhaC family protein [Escherichia coli]